MIRSALASLVMTAILLVLVVGIVLVPIAMRLPDPLAVLDMFVFGPFRNPRHAGNIVEMATPAMLCGLAVAIMFRAGIFNLGVEGAFFLGGLATVATVLVVPLPAFAMAPVGLLVGAVVGSSICAVPGYLKARYEASELVSSLMLNFAALFVGLFVVNYFLRDPAAQLIGGLIAAGAGGIEMLGLYQRFSWQSLPGNGWTGVVAAILARDNPILIIPAALFLSYLQVGGDLIARNFDVPSEAVGLIQALVLLVVTSSAIMRNPRLMRLVQGRGGAARPAEPKTAERSPA
jgi:ABC-type uncharacterized transport system permease subunit